MCACDIETPKGTSKEWMGGVVGNPELDRMSICESCWEDSLALVLFLVHTFEGKASLLAIFFFRPPVKTGLFTFEG